MISPDDVKDLREARKQLRKSKSRHLEVYSQIGEIQGRRMSRNVTEIPKIDFAQSLICASLPTL